MRITINLTSKEWASIKDIEEHYNAGEPDGDSCCHCELGEECTSILQKIHDAVMKGENQP